MSASQYMSAMDRTVFTVGHSNATLEDWLDLLRRNRIDVVADVRSSPASRYTPHFGGNQLRWALGEHDIHYLFLGRELGGRPPDRRFYDADGFVRYDLLADSEPFKEGLARVLRGAIDYRIALMCGEEDPLSCHRRRLVGRALGAAGTTVAHLRHDGRVESEQEVERRESLKYPELYQLSWGVERPWRSIHPVRDRARGPAES